MKDQGNQSPLAPDQAALVILDNASPRFGQYRYMARLWDVKLVRGKWKFTGNYSPDYASSR